MAKDKHLIRLVLALQHGDRLYLLFEWADGNLLDLWERVSSVESSSTTARWAAEQCFGIANAVKRIHGLTTGQIKRRSSTPSEIRDVEKEWGRHGDIKPSNILWFKKYEGDYNVLVVSDLGLTRYHSLHTKSLVPHLDGYTNAYAAPEVELRQPTSPKYDIWSLGCVFLEFCIWYLEGNSAVDSFEMELSAQHDSDIRNFEADTYFTVISDSENGNKSAQLKPAVKAVSTNTQKMCVLREVTNSCKCSGSRGCRLPKVPQCSPPEYYNWSKNECLSSTLTNAGLSIVFAEKFQISSHRCQNSNIASNCFLGLALEFNRGKRSATK